MEAIDHEGCSPELTVVFVQSIGSILSQIRDPSRPAPELGRDIVANYELADGSFPIYWFRGLHRPG